MASLPRTNPRILRTQKCPSTIWRAPGPDTQRVSCVRILCKRFQDIQRWMTRLNIQGLRNLSTADPDFFRLLIWGTRACWVGLGAVLVIDKWIIVFFWLLCLLGCMILYLFSYQYFFIASSPFSVVCKQATSR